MKKIYIGLSGLVILILVMVLYSNWYHKTHRINPDRHFISS